MSNKLSLEQELAALRAENDRLKQQATAKLKFKRSDKGEGIILVGLRRFPITFFEKEWAVLFSMKAEYDNFIAHNQLTDAEREELNKIAAIERAKAATVPYGKPAVLRKAIG